MQYIDGNVKKEKNGRFERDQYGRCPMPKQDGYPQWYYDGIVAATGDLHLEKELSPKAACSPSITLAEARRIDSARARKL